ncbi:MAG TPA: hypothetical protein VF916_00650 [Ktedonobacterales bacterium]
MRWTEAAERKHKHYQAQRHLTDDALERVHDLAEQIAIGKFALSHKRNEQVPIVSARDVHEAYWLLFAPQEKK